MPSKKSLSDKELKAWEASRDIAAELEQSVREMLAGQGTEVSISPVVSARMKSGLSQARFAELLGFRYGRCRNGSRAAANPRAPRQDTHRHRPETPRSAQRTGRPGFGLTSISCKHKDGWAVFVAKAGRARLKQVKIGQRNGLAAQVLVGLKAGDRVIAHPDDKIADGVKVKARPQ